MALKERDYTNMRETEKIRDAIKRNSTHIKDYSLKNIVEVSWQISEYFRSKHLVKITVNSDGFIIPYDVLSRAVTDLVERQDQHDWLPRDIIELDNYFSGAPKITIDTENVNNECLRDHVAKVTIGKSTSIIDLEELLKAIRYG